MSEENSREIKIKIRRMLFGFEVPLDLYQVILSAIANDNRSKSDNPEVKPQWILHEHPQDAQGIFLVKKQDGECVVEVLVRPTGQGEIRDFIQNLAHDHNVAFRDQT